MTGPDAQKAIEWICTADTDRPINELFFFLSSFFFDDPLKKNLIRFHRTVYTCALNGRGGVESDFMITKIESGSGQITNPKFDVSQLELVRYIPIHFHFHASVYECECLRSS